LYTIDERERGVVLRFGAFSEISTAGLHWHLPYPIETIEVVDVDSTRTAKERKVMLTKDENIVDLAVSVQYKINNVQDFLFNVANTDNVNSQTGSTLHQVMRSAIREVVGRNSMDSIIKDGREQIAQDTSKVMQSILDRYKAGIVVNKVNLTYAEAPEQVKDAFDDANRAREDMNRYHNEALAYEKKVVPAARGRAARVTEEAEGYKARLVAEAEGESSRFTQLMVEYQKAPEVTRQRLYLETIEEVLGKTRKVIVDAKSGNNIMMLPLNTTANKAPASMTEAEMNQAINAAASKKASELMKARTTQRTSTREARTLGGQ
jgi:membrane protease subunit HflK